MIVEPKVRGFVCVTAHPMGCAAAVRRQLEVVRANGAIAGGPARVLVIGASTGYGLASRVVAAFGCGAATLGIFFERPGTAKRPGSAGWYHSAAFHEAAGEAGLHALSINGDAFSDALKDQVVGLLRADAALAPLDLVVYSLASPRRQHPDTGVTHKSVLKPIGAAVASRSLNTDSGEVGTIRVEPANAAEIADTVAVMGGDDWQRWIERLSAEGLLADHCRTVAYTYIGDRLTWPLYGDATIGAAKRDLDRVAALLRERLAPTGGDVRVAVLKAVVTQASSAIPIMPLYLALLFKVMKERGTHEGCIEQIDGLLRAWYGQLPECVDSEGRLRRDGIELLPEVQREVERLWPLVTTENLGELSDFSGYQREFLGLFGFEQPGVDYGAEVDPVVAISGLVEA